MANDNVILRFSDVSFQFGHNKQTLDEASFSMRRGSKMVLMGQNGAGKTTLFKLITGELKPEEGSISINKNLSIAIAHQVIPKEKLELSIKEYFESLFKEKVYDIDPRIEKALDAVNLNVPTDRKLNDLSGGQQARILLASALIQEPDILLLDEPTNNLDKEGLEHLTKFLVDYNKTVLVISHDADFLNAFTQGVLYLDIFTHKVEKFDGNYHDVIAEISAKQEKERRQKAKAEKEMQERKDKANYFAQKGGKMRVVAKKMRDRVEELESEIGSGTREDKTIRPFTIAPQERAGSLVAKISSISVIKEDKIVEEKFDLSIYKKEKVLLSGPNGVGKTTWLERIANNRAKGVKIEDGVKVGYYRQDFSTLDPEQKVYDSLTDVASGRTEGEIRSTAAGFLIGPELLGKEIKTLSEGQKGLLCFARLVLQRPGLLILDEPTNHINFRHLPVIAKALDNYQGAMILVSHLPEFVAEIKIKEKIDLGEFLKKKKLSLSA